ncbi:MAG TPA: transferrin receptor-like dimerization domain-containing protein [Verrucomicrobiae bacterium]|jgi:N-acetylated-alpha-linked acidic dipeptidase|nr:transferrin receptor-like dimerization domain-containing protein [Verrucomicrobiae bacterium]
MKRRTAALLSLFTFSFLTASLQYQGVVGQNSVAPLQGFFPGSTQAERDWEAKFRALPNADNLREYMRVLSARPHHVGSPYDKQNAEWMLARFKEWGWDAHIEDFDVLFPTPKERHLELLGPSPYVARLEEPPVANDPTSNQQAEQLPPYNAYSLDGDVTAPLVYVNYGTRDDYEYLDRLGVSVKGAIVIARYGNSWRGIKPKVAAEHGALGCIIYSDPADDGYAQGEVYPQGPWRNKDAVQRGAVTDTYFAGDPLTPGWGSVPGAKRLDIKDSPQITKIPVLPISYGDAQPLLAAIQGPVAGPHWRGALPITYHVGPSLAKVHLVVKSNWDIKRLYDVIAQLQGSDASDQWVLRGNHHDAWVNGASDPLSGMVAELEEARALGELYRHGWEPKRTIIYAAWDGEEPGLLGSTEWLETHIVDLQQHAVAYINSDNNARGFLRVSGSHSLEHFLNGVARDVEDPETHLSVWQRAHLQRIASAAGAEERDEARKRPDFRIRALGDGSDYASFLDHAGIAAVDMRFGGEGEEGQYHSAYDDFYWFTHFSDTNFAYGRALAQNNGTAVMRLADADLLPFEFTNQADTIKTYIKELTKLLKSQQDEAKERNLELDEGVYSAISDPQKPLLAPPRLDTPPFFNFAPLENAAETLSQAAQRYDQALKRLGDNGGITISNAALHALNEKLYQSERVFLSEKGLPDRPWFKHQIYAPGAYTGYAVKTIPAVREALEQRKWSQAQEGAATVSEILKREATLVNDAAAELEKAEH